MTNASSASPEDRQQQPLRGADAIDWDFLDPNLADATPDPDDFWGDDFEDWLEDF